jgi:regulator of protease activity HflC (stomatin/prohibitin superfamily)
MKLDYILTNRQYIKNYVISEISQDAITYGIKIKGMEIESISMGKKLEQDIAKVALGRIEAKANKITAKGELESAKMIAKTAELNENNQIGLQL